MEYKYLFVYFIGYSEIKKSRSNPSAFSQLRRPDSNRRPLGYEPNELPTAPLRDVYFSNAVQRYGFYLNLPNFSVTFSSFYLFYLFYACL